MTEYPIIIDSKYIYVNLQGLIWRGDGLQSPQVLHPTAGKMLRSICQQNPDKPLIVNAINVISIEHYSINWFEKDLHCEVLFFNSETIFDDLKLWIKKNCTRSEFGGVFATDDNLIKFIEPALKEANDLLQGIIKKCYLPNDNKELIRLSSTPIKATGIYNAREIIRKPNSYNIISLRMAEILRNLISEAKALNPRILALSIRSSAFATPVSILTQAQIELIDHIGPNFRMLEGTKFNFRNLNDDYFIISDFVLGGTELKCANAIASYSGCSIKGAVCIGTLLRPDDYKLPFPLKSVADQTLDKLTDVRYEL